MNNDSVIVVPYDPRWPDDFICERLRIGGAVEKNGVRIEHIGSTAVPGLAAKPINDIMIGLKSLVDAPARIGALQALGYE